MKEIMMTNENISVGARKPNAVIQLTGHDNGAIATPGPERRVMFWNGQPELVQDFVQDTTAGDDDHLPTTCFMTVSVE